MEGPALLERGNKIHIVYSVNNSKSDEYCLGVLTCCGGDVLDAKSWVKNPKPLFEKTDEIFGPGHCAFFKAEKDGVMTDFITYHANLVSGSGWFGRNLWIQSFTWDENDMPVFGRPRWNPFED
jgi:GH43 family beta-xylosidase